MRHCGRSGLSVCVSACVSAGVKDTDKVCTTSKSVECRQWSRGAAHCWTLGPGWTCASVTPHCSPSSGKNRRIVNTRRHVSDPARARARSVARMASEPPAAPGLAGRFEACVCLPRSLRYLRYSGSEKPRLSRRGDAEREDRESLFGFVNSLIFSSSNRARSLGMVHLPRCCRRLVALF